MPWKVGKKGTAWKSIINNLENTKKRSKTSSEEGKSEKKEYSKLASGQFAYVMIVNPATVIEGSIKAQPTIYKYIANEFRIKISSNHPSANKMHDIDSNNEYKKR